jgi:prepilin-type N-terminal cleavage/methylation domain-containing protein
MNIFGGLAIHSMGVKELGTERSTMSDFTGAGKLNTIRIQPQHFNVRRLRNMIINKTSQQTEIRRTMMISPLGRGFSLIEVMVAVAVIAMVMYHLRRLFPHLSASVRHRHMKIMAGHYAWELMEQINAMQPMLNNLESQESKTLSALLQNSNVKAALSEISPDNSPRIIKLENDTELGLIVSL